MPCPHMYNQHATSIAVRAVHSAVIALHQVYYYTIVGLFLTRSSQNMRGDQSTNHQSPTTATRPIPSVLCTVCSLEGPAHLLTVHEHGFSSPCKCSFLQPRKPEAQLLAHSRLYDGNRIPPAPPILICTRIQLTNSALVDYEVIFIDYFIPVQGSGDKY